MKIFETYRRLKEDRLLVGLAMVAWLFLFLTTISKTYLLFVGRNLEIEMGYIVLRSFLIWGGVVLFLPFVVSLVRKIPLVNGGYVSVGIHLLFSILIVPLHAILFRFFVMLAYDEGAWSLESFVDSVPVIMTWLGIIDPFAYWITIGAYYLKKYYERYKIHQIQNAHLEAELASMRLHILKVQLHPHFLFNTLHSINSLIYEAPGKAKRVLVLLKRFLETSIDRVDDQQVPLKDELEFTGTYLEIEKTRFSNRLRIETDIEEDSLNELVPSFLLQPLVENAVKHGISQKMEPGMIKITSKKQKGMLHITVEDDGPGLDDTMHGGGIGLENIKQRLRQLYYKSSFKLAESTLGGLKVHIEIPLMT